MHILGYAEDHMTLIDIVYFMINRFLFGLLQAFQ